MAWSTYYLKIKKIKWNASYNFEKQTYIDIDNHLFENHNHV